MYTMTKKHKDALQLGRKRKRLQRTQHQRAYILEQVTRLDNHKSLALINHNCLLAIEPIPQEKIQQWIQWTKDPIMNQNLPAFVHTLRPDIQYYHVIDYLDNPTHGMLIITCSGWIKPFTKDEADAFINEHHPRLLKLHGLALARYIFRHHRKHPENEGGLRITVPGYIFIKKKPRP